ncbi:MAG: type II CAAX endopeptidase family protein [Chloroflexi bacterium]|nr:type II CAAX endopeptidase family protein [Chloroflexota bacterium]
MISQDALDLMARPAEQQSTIKLVAQPAPQSASASVSFAPSAWLELPEPDLVEPIPERTLGRIRMPVRVIFLTALTLALAAGWAVLLNRTSLDEELGWEWWFVVVLAGVTLIIVACWIVLPRWILRRHQASALVAWRRPTRQDVNWVCAALAVMVGVWLIYWEIVPWTGWDWALPVPLPDDANVVAFVSWWHVAIFAASAVIVAPIVEETFFRGFMLGGLNRVWWLLPSLLLSAALFSAVHFNLRVIIPFAVFGLVLGALYLRTKHLTAPALAHACWNLGATAMLIMEYGVG